MVDKKRHLKEKKRIKGTLVGVLIFVLLVASLFFDAMIIYYGWYNPKGIYSQAYNLMLEEDYINAISLYEAIDGWGDVSKRITECYIGLFNQSLECDNLSNAYKYFDITVQREPQREDMLVEGIYEYAVQKMDAFEYQTALDIFSGFLVGYRDCDFRYNLYFYERGLSYLNEGDISNAYDVFMTVDTILIPDVTEMIEWCKAMVYSAAVEEFYIINMTEDGALAMDIILPVAFFEPILTDYLDSNNYRRYANLVGMWNAKDRQKNIEIIYELDDFLNVKENGFAMQRLYQKRYINESWLYFYINKDGVAETNIPRYHLSGYYGLYSKIENGIYYIGSDEVKWTKQFSFRFDDYDQTLYVYSFAVGREYLLIRDENPIYS